MFNYFGIIKSEVTALDNSDAYKRGFKLYRVLLPQLSPDEIECAVLTLPGLQVRYDIGDQVIVGEIEEKKQDGVDHFILGRLQLQKEDRSLQIGRLYVNELYVTTGEIKAGTKLMKSTEEHTSNVYDLTANQIITKIADLEEKVKEIETLRSSLAGISTTLQKLPTGS